MQLSLGFDTFNPAPAVYERLASAFGSFRDGPRLRAIDQLFKAMVGARTHDDAAWPAYRRLKTRFPVWAAMAEASAEEIEAAIAPVAYADLKAGWLKEAVRRLQASPGGLDLDFLAGMDEAAAMAWLQKELPGVGPKVAATVLNFSTLRRRAMVVDAHVWRVARRIGLAPAAADPEATRRAIEAGALPAWSGDDLFDLHWLLKRLGQAVCMESRTRCGACPVAALCETRRRATAPGSRKAEVLTLARRG